MANVIRSIKLGATATPVIDVESIHFEPSPNNVECEIEKNDGELYNTYIPNADYEQAGVITGTTQTISGWKTIAGYSGFLNASSPSTFPEITNKPNYGCIEINSVVDYRGVSSWTVYNSYNTANPFTWLFKACNVNNSGVTTAVDSYDHGCRLEPTHYCCPTGKVEDGFTYSISDMYGYHAYKITTKYRNAYYGSGNVVGVLIEHLPYGSGVDYGSSNINRLGVTAPIIWIKGYKSTLNITNQATLNSYLNDYAYAYAKPSSTATGYTIMPLKNVNFSSLSTSKQYLNGVGCTNITIKGNTYSIGSTSHTKSVGVGGKGALGLGNSTLLTGQKRYNQGGTPSYIFELTHLSTSFLGITGFGGDGRSYTLLVGKTGSAFKVGYTGNYPILTSWNPSYPGHIGASSCPFKSMHAQYMYSSYGFYESSDETLKNILKPIETDLDKLSKLRKVYFEWKDKNNGNTGPQIGIIAQDVKKVYPEIVDGEEGSYTVQYDKLGVIALDAIDKLYQENKELKARCKSLEDRVTKLENIIIK